MPCTSPLKAWRNHSGNIVFHCSLREERTFEKLTLPCGQCIACRLAHSREWAIRCTHEMQMHEFNCWITLTYAEEYLPWSDEGYPTLSKRDVVLFLKRLRHAIKPRKFRYFGCGEYGEKHFRPHYHIMVFGYDFTDKKIIRTRGKFNVFESQLLQELWPFGHTVLAGASFESAAYTSRYCTKKINGPDAGQHYRDRVPEYSMSSNRPGIGATFFQRYSSDIIYKDEVVSRGGYSSKPPRYYDKLLGRMDPELLERNKQRRKENAVEIDDERLEQLRKYNLVKFSRMARSYEKVTGND